MTLYLMTFAPPLIILFYIIYSDAYREPIGMIIKSFIVGILLCFPALILNNLLIFSDQQAYIAGFTEETLKFLALYFYIRKKSCFNEPMDGIVYGVTVSLGFATYENYDYVFRLSEEFGVDPYQMAVWRSYSAIPMHALMGCIMGFYFGLYAFTAKKKYLVLCLLIPFIIHGLYNFLPHPAHFMILGVVIVYSIALHSQFKKMQINKKSENQQKKI